MPPAMRRLAAGSWHSHATDSAGTLWSWGYNGYGQLGDGSRLDRWTRGQVLTEVAQISTGGTWGFDHTLAVTTGNSLYSWGYNGTGELGTGDTADRWAPTWIMNGVTAVAAGDSHSLAVASGTGLYAWGYNGWGQLGDGTWTNQSRPKLIMYNVADVAAGGHHSLSLMTDRTLYAWGYNYYGQLGIGGTSSRATPAYVIDSVTAVAAGRYHTVALKTDGSLWAWGYNGYGQVGDGTTWDRDRPVRVLDGVVGMTAGVYHSLALKSDGSVWAWGYNSSGQLGDNTRTNRSAPVRVLDGVSAIAAGGYHSLARMNDGGLRAWGYNRYGQLGDGTTTQRLQPVQVSGFAPAVPAAPSNLIANAVSSTQITLTWRDNSTNEQGFRIQRNTGGTTWAHVGTVSPNVTSYLHSELTPGTTYTYRVLAFGAGGTLSDVSNTATATTPGGTVVKPAAPTSLVARAASRNQINLTWADRSSNEQGFRIERKIGSAAWVEIAQVGANTTSFASTGLMPNTTYRYRVRAFNTGGTSAYATSTAVKTPR
jgi:alpha-tubulin suppressor-like RCC1 family protein